MAPGAWRFAVAALVLRLSAGLALVVTLGGCPGGAELEVPEQFPQYPGGTTSVGGAGGSGGGGSGAGGTTSGSAGSGGFAGASGSSGASGAAGGLGCDIAAAMQNNCVKNCHTTSVLAAELDFTNLGAMATLLVDQPAAHRGIGCNAIGTLFRECTADELLVLGCPADALLVDSQNFEASWVVTKLKGKQGTCGDAMPYPPGNSAKNGWSEARRECFLAYFRSLIPAP